MEEQIKKIYEKQKNGRIRMIRNVLLIYAALICVVSIFKGNPFPHQETVLFFDVKQPGWVTTDPWLLWICVVVDLIAGIFILIRDILRDFSKIDRILSQQCDAEKYSEMLEELIKYGKSLDYHGFQKSVMLIAESKYVVALIINGQLQKAEEYIKNEWEGKREGRSWQQVMTNLELSKKYLPFTACGFDDPRVDVHIQDGLRFVRKVENEYDLIIVDSTDPFGVGEGLFTKEFYGNCYKALKADGILVNQHESTFYTSYANSMKRAHSRIKSFFPIALVYQAHIPTYPSGHWLFGFASKKYDPRTDLQAVSCCMQ